MPTYRHKSHCVFVCDYHIVFPTKYRRKIINPGVKAFLLKGIEKVKEHHPDVMIKEINTDQDHIHMLISIPPQWAVGKVVGIIKSNTARNLKAEFPFLKEVYWGTESIWSEGYFVSQVGINEQTIRKYIEQQGQADAGQTSLLV